MDLFVGAANGDSVRRFNGKTGAFISNFTSGGPIGGHSCPMFGPNGNLYVKQWSYGGAINQYHGVSGVLINTVVPFTYGGGSAILFGPDGRLYAEEPNGDINRYDGLTGVLLGTFVPRGSGGLAGIGGMRFGADGNLYVRNTNLLTDTFNVLRYNGTTGTFIDEFVTSGSGGLGANGDIIFGPDGNLYVADSQNNVIRRYNRSTGAFTDTFASGGGLKHPYGLTFGPDGNLYVADHGNDVVLRFNGTTGEFIDTFASPTFPVPTYITFGGVSFDFLERHRIVSYVTYILYGVVADSPGVVIPPGGGPQPVPPWAGRIWDSLSPAEQDALLGLVVSKLASLINNPQTRKEIQRAVLNLVSREMRQLMQSLTKG